MSVSAHANLTRCQSPVRPRARFEIERQGGCNAMNIHEYQAKALLRTYGAPVSDGRVVLRAEEAKTAAGELDGPLWVVKAQIHAGGRGKGKFKEADAGDKGGVRLAKSVDEAAAEAKKMLGRTLVTHQTGPAGKQVNRIYIEDGAGIDRELYLALLVDRDTSRIASSARPRAAWISRRSPPRRPRRSSASPSIPPPATRRSTAAASPSRWAWKASRSSNASADGHAL